MLLTDILGADRVYFQPPPTVQLEYPCIIYERDRRRVFHADNRPYAHKKGYRVTVIDRNPDSDIPEKIADLPLCSFDRFFAADNLNHDVYNLYF